MPLTTRMVTGVVLAGGAGRRIGGDKAMVEVNGVTLAERVVAVVARVVAEVAVVAKRETALPALPLGVSRWIEPDEPRHPLAGLTFALRCSAERPILACACDLPLITEAVLERLLAEATATAALAIVPRAGDRLQPLCAIYTPAALPRLAAAPAGARLTEVVAGLDPLLVEFDDPQPFLTVNNPEDVLMAGALLSRT